MSDRALDPKQLIGTWALVRAVASDADGEELAAPYGPKPMGRLVLNADGRMMAVLCDGRTRVPDGEKRAYSSYCGNYRIDGDRLITSVDAALLPERIGGEQVRTLEMKGNLLILRPPARTDGSQRELYWKLLGPA